VFHTTTSVLLKMTSFVNWALACCSGKWASTLATTSKVETNAYASAIRLSFFITPYEATQK